MKVHHEDMWVCVDDLLVQQKRSGGKYNKTFKPLESTRANTPGVRYNMGRK